MYTFQVCGYSNSGKTTLLKELIYYFSQQGKHVASIKDIHSDKFHIDEQGKNTYVHKQAGANPVIARGLNETDFLYNQKMEFTEITSKISADWLLVEGFNSFPLPKIICGKNNEEVDAFFDRRTFAIAGKISETYNTYKELPVFNPLDKKHVEQLVKLINEKVFPMLPYVDDNCCNACGLTCSKMVEAILNNEKSYSDCKIRSEFIQLKIGSKNIPIVKFVQNILKNNVLAVVSELTGWEKGKRIEIVIKEE